MSNIGSVLGASAWLVDSAETVGRVVNAVSWASTVVDSAGLPASAPMSLLGSDSSAPPAAHAPPEKILMPESCQALHLH